MAARSPSELLFTDREGKPTSVQDVAADGLDGGYEDRIPELEELLVSGSPYHRLMACVVLISWGEPAGFRTLIQWASDPAHVPWADYPVTADRLSGVDDAFANLADGLNASFWNEPAPALRQMQLDAGRALLAIYADCFFGRTLALALIRDKGVPPELKGNIVAASEAGLAAIRNGSTPHFDIASQIASLIFPLAVADDDLACRFADQLTPLLHNNARALRELALALASGTGEATRRSLEGLRHLGIPAVTEEADKALARRQGNIRAT
jgi:hypothetical protein